MTLSGAAEARLGKLPFKIVILDEASQATEPSTLIPLVRFVQLLCSCKRLLAAAAQVQERQPADELFLHTATQAAAEA